MKVAFLIHSLEVSGCRYRVLQYLPFLKERGIEASVHFFKMAGPDRLKLYHRLDQYDLLYIHRKLFFPAEFWYIRKKARKIIYDFDDAIMYRSSGSKDPYSLSRRIKFAYMMRRVDSAIAGNQFLKSEGLPYNPRVEVIPTSIDLSRYTVKNSFDPSGALTIGWLGSGSTLKYLKARMPAFENLYRNYPHFQLKMVCDQFLDGFSLPLVKKDWAAKEEEADLKSFDIGVMPLADDPWSKGKCGLKILQYYSVGVPVVCTPVGVNREIVHDGVNGFWAESQEEWEDRLGRLIQNGDLRKKMGLKGRQVVEQEYSLEVNGPRILEIMNRVAGERCI
jgi:glycosyltransferase involved in cell wall biosynthesis